MKKILISWSIAYDFIMDYENSFWDAINKDSSNNISASLLINKLKKEAWWTWLNIAFNLAMLWENAILLWAVWDDYIFDWFMKEKINLSYIHKSEKLLSASAYIINDKSGWQITSFYPWAITEADNTSINKVKEILSYTMISPNKKETMINHLMESSILWIKTFFDPGQMLGAFSKEDLINISNYWDYLIVNENEFTLYQKISEKEEIELLDDFEIIIVTLWSKWSKIINRTGILHIKPVEVENVLDPTWAWDAYRAWLLKWLILWLDFETSAKIWSVVSSYCVQFHWGQNHFLSTSMVKDDLNTHFWLDIEI